MVLYKLQFAPMLSVVCGCGGIRSCFVLALQQLPGLETQARKSIQWQSCLTRSQACSAAGAMIANGTGFVLSRG